MHPARGFDSRPPPTTPTTRIALSRAERLRSAPTMSSAPSTIEYSDDSEDEVPDDDGPLDVYSSEGAPGSAVADSHPATVLCSATALPLHSAGEYDTGEDDDGDSDEEDEEDEEDDDDDEDDEEEEASAGRAVKSLS